MNIAGLQKTTLLDFPGHIACTVFLAGCNLRCPFCHNAPLVLPEQFQSPQMSQTELLSFLKTRQRKLRGVCITGGEPTLYRDLPQLLEEIRSLGFLTKLDTNGTNPSMLQSLLERHLVDYVAMDIKNSPSRYAQTCGNVDFLEQVKRSAALLMESGVDYEFRTTVCHPFHDAEAMAQIGQWLQGARRYYLQQFVDSGQLVGSGISAHTPQQLEQLRQAVLPFIENTYIRGI